MARYADLKRERDEAVRAAVEAERFSRREEVERLERDLRETAEREGELAAKLYLAREFAAGAVEGYLGARMEILRQIFKLDDGFEIEMEKIT